MSLRTALALALAALVIVALAFLRSLPAAPDRDRSLLYLRTLEVLRSSCDPARPETDSYCSEQAGLLLEFPECDSACVELARRIRHEPSR